MSSLSSLFVSILLLLPTLATAADTKCYNLNGTTLDSSFEPCIPSSGSKHSGCCATNRSSGSPDICLDSGLCMATNDKFVGTIWQNGCTDATGKDEACPKMCPDATSDFDGLNPVASWNIQTCNYGSYCCRSTTDKGNCCNNSTAPKFTTSFLGALQLSTSTVSVSTSASPTALPTPSTTLDPAALATTTPNSSASTSAPSPVCKKDQSLLVGGAVGGTLGAALLGLIAVILWIHKKEKRQRKLKEHYEAQFEQSWALRKTLAGASDSARDVSTPVEKEAEVSTSDYTYGGVR
ncbi:hypothetical protein K505DRAFT_356014 [Melanomma pulvis-pyrius CBS 109.77]|uniref:Mid2 domain-containing protein n=1 Tax=Melanomma pulvis-pyrius CBS 109.77 TaxID=1314802 RepID=A0A6A6XVN7_9PLEO|nr:hypothetical protein K505DRAFT_356014 [Melanomma pulvis-pyrius CBS 109.77]